MRENVGRFARRALANRRQISGISCKSLYKYERRRFTAESLNWDQRVNLQYLESEKQTLIRPRGISGPVADIEELNASDKLFLADLKFMVWDCVTHPIKAHHPLNKELL